MILDSATQEQLNDGYSITVNSHPHNAAGEIAKVYIEGTAVAARIVDVIDQGNSQVVTLRSA